MNATRPLRRRKDLLLCFDAFGTLFHPKEPIPEQYGRFAQKYGIETANNTDVRVEDSFRRAFKSAAKTHPNYGKAVGMDHEKWWAMVISNTFQPFLKSDQTVPHSLIQDLITQFSTSAGYSLYPDVLPFFRLLREAKTRNTSPRPESTTENAPNTAPYWPWTNTTVGIITNSDSRVPGILSSLGLSVSPRRFGEQQRSQTQNESNNTETPHDIDFTVLSYDVGHSKPSPPIFTAAATIAATLPVHQSKSFKKLYVGDSLVEDYLGAKRAGWNSLLLDRTEHDDNLKIEGIVRYRTKGNRGPGGQKGQAEEVDVIRDLDTLREWRPVNYLVKPVEG